MGAKKRRVLRGLGIVGILRSGLRIGLLVKRRVVIVGWNLEMGVVDSVDSSAPSAIIPVATRRRIRRRWILRRARGENKSRS